MTDTHLSARPAPMVRAWDGPTRVFKWTLVALVVSAPLAKNVGDVLLTWHRWNGYAILTLLVWRVLWGFAGSTTARFATFLRPVMAITYARQLVSGQKRRFLGHNPLGGLMVVALMVALAAQALAGLFTTDDIVVDGPFVHLAARDLVKAASAYHETGFLIVMALALIHILANVVYSVRGPDKTIPAMVNGLKPKSAYEDAPETQGGSWARAGVLLIVAVAIVLGGMTLAGGKL